MSTVARACVALALVVGCTDEPNASAPSVAPAPAREPPAAPAPGRPDVLLVTVDTLRADHLGCYGYARATSPHLDRLASEGVVLARAVAQGAWTFGTVPSLLTSRYPQDHGDFWVGHGAAVLDPTAETLPALLREAGYRTVLRGGHGSLGAIVGLRDSFDVFDDELREGGAVADAALRDLASRDDPRPLFLWVHFMDPHAPYAPPAPFDHRFVDDGLSSTGRTAPFVEHSDLGTGGIPRVARIGDHHDVDFYVARYDGEIAYADTQLGRVLDAVRNRARSTLVTVTADHGESLGEHDLFFSHNHDLHAPIVHVPWVVAWPGHVARGRTDDALVMAVDVLPTLAGLLGLRPDAARNAAWVGRDLGPCITSRVPCESRDAFAIRGRQASITTPEHKLVCEEDATGCALYDLGRDPGETRDVARRHPDVVAQLRERLSAWLAAHPRSHAVDESGMISEIDEDTARALRALGYVE